MFIARCIALLFVGSAVIGSGSVFSQDYPNKTIRIVTTTPGGGNDFTSRLLVQGIGNSLGQQIVIVNNQSTVLAAEMAAKSAPDGYTLYINGVSHWITPLLQKTPYEPLSDFAPISQMVKEALIVAVHPSLPVKSIKELVALAKAKPGELNYASGGIAGPSHITAEVFKSVAGVNIVHVPYKGGTTAIAGLMGGEVQLLIADLGLMAPHVKSGKIRALAVTSAEPSAFSRELPTVAASGLPGFDEGTSTGIYAPAKTPTAIIIRLNQEVVRALALPDVKEKFANNAIAVVGSSPEQYTAIIKAEMAKVSKVIKDTGMKVN